MCRHVLIGTLSALNSSTSSQSKFVEVRTLFQVLAQLLWQFWRFSMFRYGPSLTRGNTFLGKCSLDTPSLQCSLDVPLGSAYWVYNPRLGFKFWCGQIYWEVSIVLRATALCCSNSFLLLEKREIPGIWESIRDSHWLRLTQTLWSLAAQTSTFSQPVILTDDRL